MRDMQIISLLFCYFRLSPNSWKFIHVFILFILFYECFRIEIWIKKILCIFYLPKLELKILHSFFHFYIADYIAIWFLLLKWLYLLLYLNLFLWNHLLLDLILTYTIIKYLINVQHYLSLLTGLLLNKLILLFNLSD